MYHVFWKTRRKDSECFLCHQNKKAKKNQWKSLKEKHTSIDKKLLLSNNSKMKNTKLDKEERKHNLPISES
jgi:hypothetical protein